MGAVVSGAGPRCQPPARRGRGGAARHRLRAADAERPGQVGRSCSPGSRPSGETVVREAVRHPGRTPRSCWPQPGPTSACDPWGPARSSGSGGRRSIRPRAGRARRSLPGRLLGRRRLRGRREPARASSSVYARPGPARLRRRPPADGGRRRAWSTGARDDSAGRRRVAARTRSSPPTVRRGRDPLPRRGAGAGRRGGRGRGHDRLQGRGRAAGEGGRTGWRRWSRCRVVRRPCRGRGRRAASSTAGPGGPSAPGSRSTAAGDHRMAMAAAVAASAAGPGASTISGFDAVATSYPAFAEDLARLDGPSRVGDSPVGGCPSRRPARGARSSSPSTGPPARESRRSRRPSGQAARIAAARHRRHVPGRGVGRPRNGVSTRATQAAVAAIAAEADIDVGADRVQIDGRRRHGGDPFPRREPGGLGRGRQPRGAGAAGPQTARVDERTSAAASSRAATSGRWSSPMPT